MMGLAALPGRPARRAPVAPKASLGLVAILLTVSFGANASDMGVSTPEPAPYVDRLIDDGKLAPIVATELDAAPNRQGNPRSLIVEIGGSIVAPKTKIVGIAAPGLDQTQREAGILLSGRYQTDNFGQIGIDAQLQRGTGSGLLAQPAAGKWLGAASVSTRDLPLGRGWLADVSVGSVATPAIDLARRQARFYLPQSPVLGVSAVLERFPAASSPSALIDPQPVTSFNFAVGEPGLLGGMRLAQFRGLSGLAASAGGQFVVSPGLTTGIQALAATNTRDPYNAIFEGVAPASSAPVTATALMGSVAYRNGRLRLQANAIVSDRSSAADTATARAASGGWIDVGYRVGRSSHSGGLYYFEPGLSWGASAVMNNVYGAYYRVAGSSQRWRWTVSLDGVHSLDGRSASGMIVNTDVRRAVGFETTLGINSTFRIANGERSSQVLGFLELAGRLGSTRTEIGWAGDPRSNHYRLAVNQNWDMPDWMPSGSRLSTQLSYDHRRMQDSSAAGLVQRSLQKYDGFSAALSAGSAPTSDISFDATLAYSSNANAGNVTYGPVDAPAGPLGVVASEQGRAFSASLSASVRLSTSWTLSASYIDTSSSLTSNYGLQSAFTSPLGVTADQAADLRRSTYRLRAGYLTLRRAVSAGTPRSSLGARSYSVGGTGALEGRVFLDGNSNGQREPLEQGVPGILVILDASQAVRTDESGYFRFESIADGRHRITVNADALPLPWVIENPDRRGSAEPFSADVGIRVRRTTVLEIAATRD